MSMHAFGNHKNFKPPVARKLAVRHSVLRVVARKLAVRHARFACLTAILLATVGFIKLFHKIP